MNYRLLAGALLCTAALSLSAQNEIYFGGSEGPMPYSTEALTAAVPDTMMSFEGAAPNENGVLASATAGSMWFGSAEDFYDTLGLNYQSYRAVALMWMTPEDRSRFAGCKITALKFWTSTITDPTALADIVILDDLTTIKSVSKTLYHQRFPLVNEYHRENTIEFDTPFTITEGDEPLYIGWHIYVKNNIGWDNKNEPSTHHFGFDYKYGKESYRSDLLGWKGPEDTEWKWKNYGQTMGEFVLFARIEGENLPINDVVLRGIDTPSYTNANDPIEARLRIYNDGSNDITSVQVTAAIGKEEPQVIDVTLDEPLAQRGTDTIAVSFSYPGEGANLPLTLTVSKVNGMDDPTPDNNVCETLITAVDKANMFTRNVVIEEGTGLWCSWCPRGIVAMEQLAQKYRNDGRLIQVAVHYNDKYTIDGIKAFIYSYMPGFPAALIDRGVRIDPYPEALEAAYLKALDKPSIAKVSVEAIPSDDGLWIDLVSHIEFALNVKGDDYSMVYWVVEDELGPEEQKNGYSKTGENINYMFGKMAGWEELPEKVVITLNDVAVAVNPGKLGAGLGEQDVFDALVRKGQVTEHGFTVDTDLLMEPDNCRFIAMVYNNRTHEIENAAWVGKTHVSAPIVRADESAPAEYYNLQGIRINPETAAPGLYIRRQGNAATKVTL